MMGFRRSDLQEAFFVPGTHAFRMWGYGTTDPLDEVLAPGYFAAASGMLRPGELIYVSVRPPATPARGTAPGEAQMALVMVRPREPHWETADGSVRLVQDFGRPSDSAGKLAVLASASEGAAPPAPVKRGRGRPRGSRNQALVAPKSACSAAERPLL